MQPFGVDRTNVKKIAYLIGCLFLLLSFIVESSHAKSYSIKSLSSEVYIRGGGDCALDIVEYFDYEFVGSYSRIGRVLWSRIQYAYDVSVTLLSNNATYSMRTSIETINYYDYIVMYLSPSTPPTETTRISFKLSYTIVPNTYSSKFITKFINIGGFNETRYDIDYYYNNAESPIETLISTFIFSPTISFRKYPQPDSFEYGMAVDNRTVRNLNKNVSILYSTVNFLPSTLQFDNCSTIVDMKYPTPAKSSRQSGTTLIPFEIFAIVAGSLAGFICIVLAIGCGIASKYKNQETKHLSWFEYLKKGACCTLFGGGGGGGNNGGGDDRGSTGYTSFNDNDCSNSNSNNWDSGGGGGGGNDSGNNWGGSGFAD
ncbi:predicted protein [Naegleria gruberi]|uniref:Predicted protein n=1 Tax=Naegleria gruberi TaxID=5762 RepID=D2VGL3_NAEGR|nr:uncharacterized protein NAEGRDRAFT_68020 [Naegleria gruberi]EFC43985.1 predicted protein [Naegleria gruberi]|eukprot:XP_002676729.1 predicted protein [Naegleria gruberi strain NEG-M]